MYDNIKVIPVGLLVGNLLRGICVIPINIHPSLWLQVLDYEGTSETLTYLLNLFNLVKLANYIFILTSRFVFNLLN